ncbi:MAG: hypothetical protein ACRDRV_05140 [Pseudonocardiaceae bacterium]
MAGSELGAAGTLIGAAGASVICTVTSAVYRASLERSREKVRVLAQRTRPLPISRDRSGAGTGELGTMPSQTDSNVPGSGDPTGSADPETPGSRVRRFLTLRWATVVVGSVGAFVLAMMLITGFEWTSGKTLGGGGGTTLGQVARAPQGPQNPGGPSAPSSSSAPTSEASTEPTATTPTTSPTTGPTASPTTSTTTPAGDSDREQSPAPTSRPPARTTTPPLLPTYLPGPGDR